ncbi:hypothetical protein EDB85DRAFT_1872004, partial [Lactarius pseudohatsudake]
LQYRTPNELNKIIDTELPGRPRFKCEDMTIAGNTLQFYFRDVLQCIRTIYGDPEFARDLVFAPERHYTDHERTCRVYSEMHTGDWWWAVQTSLEAHRPGATVIPVIISSDKTQLTLFRGKAAYPVYLTIGNIPKDIRRKPSRHAQMLIGYLPTARLETIGNKTARRRALANIFHFCMRHLLAPIASHGETGITMMSGDGVWRRCHPIFAVFVGDYPEQVLVTCTLNGRCPKCVVHRNDLGDYSRSPLRDYDEASEAFLLADGDVRAFHSTCHEASLKPVFHPFWEALPLTNVFVSITPDILHQMLQGVMKHLIAWLKCAFGPTQIDTQCRSLPPNHHIMTFAKGISTLSRISGLEHKQMCRILLGLIIELPLPSGGSPARVIRTVRALLDFLYLAQLPSHTTETLLRLEESLARFHNNKDVFVDLGVREHFKIPKLHSLLHYKSSITLFGSTAGLTTDNYNTEQTERLHIDLTKDAYRATNRKDEYPQMTAWLERREKIQLHMKFVEWRQQAQHDGAQRSGPIGPSKPVPRTIQMARNPSLKAVSFNDLADKYRALDFQDALADFIAQFNHPRASATALRALAEDTLLPFRHVPVFHKIKFVSTPDLVIIDAVHVRPDQRDARGRTIPSRFDTVICKGPSNYFLGLQIAQVRVVFQLPNKVLSELFPSADIAPPTHLAYVEWFSPIPTTPDSNSGLYKVSRLTRNGRCLAGVIPVDSIYSSVHLLPRFGQLEDITGCNTFSVLELCHSFYINPFSSRDIYLLFL